jgi:hypothetical protein
MPVWIVSQEVRHPFGCLLRQKAGFLFGGLNLQHGRIPYSDFDYMQLQ